MECLVIINVINVLSIMYFIKVQFDSMELAIKLSILILELILIYKIYIIIIKSKNLFTNVQTTLLS